MEFEYQDGNYRVERGVSTGRWLLMENLPTNHLGWRFITAFDAGIRDEDILDRAKVHLKEGLK